MKRDMTFEVLTTVDIKARFILERAVCDTERGDTEPGTAFVF